MGAFTDQVQSLVSEQKAIRTAKQQKEIEKQKEKAKKEELKQYKMELQQYLYLEFENYFKIAGSSYIVEFYNRERKKEILQGYFKTIKKESKEIKNLYYIPFKTELTQFYYDIYNKTLKRAEAEQKQQENYEIMLLTKDQEAEAEAENETQTENENITQIVKTIFLIIFSILFFPLVFLIGIIYRLFKI